MEIINGKIGIAALKKMAAGMFGGLVKAVVDVDKGIIAVDAELHADEETFLIENGSKQTDLWGINIYPEMDRAGPEFIEFDSMINLRPFRGNRSRGVEDAAIRERIIKIVREAIE